MAKLTESMLRSIIQEELSKILELDEVMIDLPDKKEISAKLKAKRESGEEFSKEEIEAAKRLGLDLTPSQKQYLNRLRRRTPESRDGN